VEIEAKYSVADPAVFAALLEVRALGEYALRPTGSRDVIDHYDTPIAILRRRLRMPLREVKRTAAGS
jgi:hypothetical protein